MLTIIESSVPGVIVLPVEANVIWTIGHSTRSLEEFVGLLESFEIELLADIRSFPGSRRYPQFNKEALVQSLPNADIAYIHLLGLGGRRRARPDSTNTVWRNAAFRGYADYMETDAFEQAIQELEEMATRKRTAYMCSEAVWWRCHRSMVSDYLKAKAWKVIHIMGAHQSMEHPFTAPAQERQGELFYGE